MNELYPLGVVPRDIWLIQVKQQRFMALRQAIKRYERAKVEVPNEFTQEYLELMSDLEMS